MNDNYLALRLSCSNAALDPAVRVTLLNSSGLRADAAMFAADGAYLPLTLTELKGGVDHTAGSVRHADDPRVLASLFNGDRRVAVRSAIACNPNIDAATAVAAARWIAERGEPLPANLVERADIDTLVTTLHASYLTGDANSAAEDPARWVAAMSVGQLRSAFRGTDDHPQLGGWAAPIAAHAATSERLSEAELDTLFAAAGPRCRLSMVDALMASGDIPDHWMRRLAGQHKLFLDALDRKGYGGYSSYGSSARKFSLNPELLDAVFDFDVTDDDNHGSFAMITSLVSSARANDWELTPALAGRLAAIRCDRSHANGAVVAGTLAGLAGRITADAAETFFELLGTMAARCGDKLIVESIAPAAEHLLTSPELAVTFLQAADTTAVATSWLEGTFAAGTCTDDAVGVFVASLDETNTALTAFAAHPQRWGHNPDAVAAVLSSDKAIRSLLESERCPRHLVDTLVARAADCAPPAATGQRWIDTLSAAAADIEPVGEDHRQVIMTRYELDPQLHTAFISTTGRCHAWVTGRYPLNQPQPAQVGDVIDVASKAGEMATLQSVIESRCIDAELIGRACSAYTNGCALVSHGEIDKLRSALHHYELPADDVATVLTKFSELAGEWLAGEFVNNEHPDLLQQVLDAHRNASTYRKFAEFSDTVTGPIAEWVASIPGVLLDDHVASVRIVAQVLRDRLGDDAAAWQLFCELGDRSELSIDEVLSMVQA